MAAHVATRTGPSAVRFPFHPFLFAAYPVLFLYANNLTDVPPEDILGPLAAILGGTALALGILALLWHDAQRAALVVSAVMVPLLLFERILGATASVLDIGSVVLLVGCFIGIGIAVLVAIRLRAGTLVTLTTLLNIVSLVLVLLAALPVASHVASSRSDTSLEGATAVAGTGAATDRDIWYLVFDRYGSDRAIDIGYDIEGNDLLPWLREQGFQILDDSHANYIRTDLSLASTLNLTHLDELAAEMGPDSSDYGPITRALRSSTVAATLKERGYDYVHVGSWFDPTRTSRLADRNLNAAEDAVTFASTLYDLSALPTFVDLLGVRRRAGLDAKHERTARYEFARLDELVHDEPGPSFVFAHLLMPHPPYVFLADGTFAPKDATYESQMDYTNARIKEIVSALLARAADEQPIIILQADEGPYPARYQRQRDRFDWSAATADELAMKFGILNAMYLPGEEGHEPLRSDLTPVNTFRTLFRRYFGTDLPDLPDRVFTSSKARPYAFLDVTDRILLTARGSEPSVPPADVEQGAVGPLDGGLADEVEGP